MKLNYLFMAVSLFFTSMMFSKSCPNGSKNDDCTVDGRTCKVANPGSAISSCDGGCPPSFPVASGDFCYQDFHACETQRGKGNCYVAGGGLCGPNAPGSKVCKGACTLDSPYKGCGWCYPSLDQCHKQCGKDKGCHKVGVSACECKGDGVPNYTIVGSGDYEDACTSRTSPCAIGCPGGVAGVWIDGGYKKYSC